MSARRERSEGRLSLLGGSPVAPRVRWWWSAPWESRRAKWTAFWHYIVCRYRYELCRRCGGRVMAGMGSWWHTDDALWLQLNGAYAGVLCAPCFTRAADAAGILIYWHAVVAEVRA